MSGLDWNLLAPQRPLGVGDPFYIPRPEGKRLSSKVRSGARLVAVVGPVGGGKSTELAACGAELLGSHVVAPCLLDHFQEGALERTSLPLSGDSVLRLSAAFLVAGATSAGCSLDSKYLKKVSPEQGVPGFGVLSLPGEPQDLLLEAIREVKRAAPGQPPVLLVDGLEKWPPEVARSVLSALLQVATQVSLVVVVPTSLAVGPEAVTVTESFRLHSVQPVAVREEPGAPWREGRGFLRSIVARRFQLNNPAPAELERVLDRAAEASGGVPRVFLQLVQDAGFYGKLAGRELPTMDDLREAMSDQTESLRRLLAKGDRDELLKADGTDGGELDTERRVRLLAHGLLLEYGFAEGTVVHPTPLLAPLLARRAA